MGVCRCDRLSFTIEPVRDASGRDFARARDLTALDASLFHDQFDAVFECHVLNLTVKVVYLTKSHVALSFECAKVFAMRKQHAIQLAGSAKALAELLGITQGAISQWGEELPPLRTYELREMKPEWFACARRKQTVSNDKT